MTKRVSIHYTRIFYYYFNCDYSIHFFKSSDEFQPILIQIWSFSRLYGLLDHRSHGMTHALCMLPIARGHPCSLIVASLGFSRSPFTIFIEDKFWACYLLFTWYLIYLHVMKSAHPCLATAIRIHNIVSNSICVSIFVWKTIEESILWTYLLRLLSVPLSLNMSWARKLPQHDQGDGRPASSDVPSDDTFYAVITLTFFFS